VLARVLANFGCVTGTVHRTDPATGLLMLVTQHGIPPHVLPMLLPKIDNIPFGKGIAGCAAQRKEAVQLCNLQEDLGGVAKPDAQKTNVQGALAVPIVGADGKVIGVLGIGKMQPYEFNDSEVADLSAVAALISAKI
jgi:signal transduction protein with GAF and PtsI domain